ncbi:MAG: hypothetical protein R2733_17105 [Acidimicrobiales bacterium]
MTRAAWILAWVGVSTIGVWWFLEHAVVQPWWDRTDGPELPVDVDLIPSPMFAAFFVIPAILLVLPLVGWRLRSR